MAEHLYIVTYDISSPKRWRSIFKIMNGYGEWLQYSVFQCRFSTQRRAELLSKLDTLIQHDEDHVLMFDLGVADKVTPKVSSIGKKFESIDRSVVVV